MVNPSPILNNCPACGAVSWKQVFDVIDHSISNEQFRLYECDQCTLRITANAPGSEEIGRYYQSSAYISHSNTRKGLVNQLYQGVRKITLSQKNKLIRSHYGEGVGNLLDFGSGAGAFVSYMQKNNWKVTGIEPAENARAMQKANTELNFLTLLASIHCRLDSLM